MRVSDSGLGCGPGGSGFHGWPFCNGDVVPGIDLNSIIEYSHRALAGIVGILMLALLVQAWRRYRSNRTLLWVCAALVLSVFAQAVLGGATVEENLEEALRRRPPLPGDAAARRPAVGRARLHPRHVRRRPGGRRRAASSRSRSSPACSCSPRSSPAATWPARRSTGGPTTSSATAPTTPAASSSRPATASFMPFGAVAPGRHPPHPPRVHVPRGDRRARARAAGAAPAPERGRRQDRLGPARAGLRSRCSWAR